MSLRWLVLLVALAACLRLGRAQADPLPLSLVDLVVNSPISSMKDLQRLLDDHFVEEEEEEDKGSSNITHKRLPRSLAGVQEAQLAACKVRTEVMEVTRSMLDRTNANFLLWPLCVEVQRCSGCCNTRVPCVPATTQTRHLQMTKITFVDKQAVYEKVIIPVEDHLTCSCKPRTSSHSTLPKTPTQSPSRILTKPATSKSQSKEELHRNDDLKHNQRFQLDDRETQWQTKYTPSQTQHTPTHTLTSTHTNMNQHTLKQMQYSTQGDVSTRRTTLVNTRMISDTTQHLMIQKNQTESEKVPELQKHQTALENISEHHIDHLDSEKVPEHHKHSSESEKILEHQTDPTRVDDSMKASSSIEHTRYHQKNDDKVTKQQPDLNHFWTTNHRHSQPDTNLHHTGQLEAPVVTYSHLEVIGQSSGQSELSDLSEMGNNQNSQSETEKPDHHHRHQHHHHHHNHHHHHHPTQSPTQHPQSTVRTVMNAPQSTHSTPHTSPPTVPQRKRRRKQRRRMSKSAMRAMIMVMS